MSLLVDLMTHLGEVISIARHGLVKIDSQPMAKASFEQTMDHFINAAIYNEKDDIKSISSRIMIGRVINGGTGCFDIIMDTDKLINSEYIEDETGGRTDFIKINDNVLIGQNVTIMDFAAHGTKPNERRNNITKGKVIINDNVWIGNNVIILKNTEIGKNSVVAAGAVVSGVFPSNVIIGGIPARVIKKIID